jgi:uncharacterized protein YqfA (UPF0365 family)
MGTSKHRKGHKQKAQARKQKMVAKRKQVDVLVQELQSEMVKLHSNEPMTVMTNGREGITLTETPNDYTI